MFVRRDDAARYLVAHRDVPFPEMLHGAFALGAHEYVFQSCSNHSAEHRNHASCPFLHNFLTGVVLEPVQQTELLNGAHRDHGQKAQIRH